MPTRNISLTREVDRFVGAKISSDQYANTSEVVRAGLRALEQDEREDQLKLEALKQAIQEGIDSGWAEGDVMQEMRKMIWTSAESGHRVQSLT